MQKTFQEISKSWCETKRPIVKRSTMCAYLLTLQTRLLPCFGAKTAIAEDEVQQFVFNKLSCGLARKTVRDMVAALKFVARYGGTHKTFPFGDWEIEYSADTEMSRLPALTLRHQRMDRFLGMAESHNLILAQ